MTGHRLGHCLGQHAVGGSGFAFVHDGNGVCDQIARRDALAVLVCGQRGISSRCFKQVVYGDLFVFCQAGNCGRRRADAVVLDHDHVYLVVRHRSKYDCGGDRVIAKGSGGDSGCSRFGGSQDSSGDACTGHDDVG